MSIERELTNINTETGETSTVALVAEEKQSVVELERGLTKQQIKAKLIEVADRGFTFDRLHVPIPGDLHGEWIHKDDKDLYSGMGFEDGTKFVEARALHSSNSVGDVTFMVCAMSRKEALDELRKDKFEAMHGVSGRGNQAEEREYSDRVRKNLGTDFIPPIAESNTQRISGTEIGNALGNK